MDRDRSIAVWRQNGSSESITGMPYEFQTEEGLVRLVRLRGKWVIVFNGDRAGSWASPDDAVQALVQRRSGLAGWDGGRVTIPSDLVDWRPVGDSI